MIDSQISLLKSFPSSCNKYKEKDALQSQTIVPISADWAVFTDKISGGAASRQAIGALQNTLNLRIYITEVSQSAIGSNV